jgi:hypothetical protein
MPERKRQHEQDRTADASGIARQQVGREADVRQTGDQSPAQAHLHNKVVEWQQRALDQYANETSALQDQHSRKRHELTDVHATERPGIAPAREVDQKADVETLERFQQTQREQLSQRQQLEQSVFQEQTKAVADLEARQRNQLDALVRVQTWIRQTESSNADTNQRLLNLQQQLEVRQQQERAQLDARFQAQLEALQEHRDTMRAQMDRDQGMLQQALYGEHQRTQHQAALRDVLDRQKAVQPELDQAIRRELANLEQQRDGRQLHPDTQAVSVSENAILDQKVSRHKVILDLWQDAVNAAKKTPDVTTAKGARKAYVETMARFLTRLTNENDPQAKAARKLFEDAGFKFLSDESGRLKKNLPLLNLPEIEKKIDISRHADLLRVSGQHLKKIEDSPQEALKADNLVFMIARDNMYMDLENELAEEIRKLTVSDMEKENE